MASDVSLVFIELGAAILGLAILARMPIVGASLPYRCICSQVWLSEMVAWLP